MPVVQLALDANKVTPGILGFVVCLAVGLALWGLLKSMNKQMRKIDFDEGPADEGPRKQPRGLRAHRIAQQQAQRQAMGASDRPAK
ncbi:hypothetical protein BIV57_03515 [Mangrovactinospora gilvigrisea]|uniref:Uncharacterized protein n=1 Tax=Mangrovactinospora gilvigrisea TaxID=1428644 RepID=A0A1J7BZI2_9ACTN|nr:hypothetical protein [Mangrovactinospora gilvigrisea]OIV38889.1 hypothetical protein BIV57_03515 [Mangrovactinospora gilvigrisea]